MIIMLLPPLGHTLTAPRPSLLSAARTSQPVTNPVSVSVSTSPSTPTVTPPLGAASGSTSTHNRTPPLGDSTRGQTSTLELDDSRSSSTPATREADGPIQRSPSPYVRDEEQEGAEFRERLRKAGAVYRGQRDVHGHIVEEDKGRSNDPDVIDIDAMDVDEDEVVRERGKKAKDKETEGNSTGTKSTGKKSKGKRKAEAMADESPEEERGTSCIHSVAFNWSLISHFLDRMMKDWSSPTYSFFRPVPKVEINKPDGRRVHLFECYNKGCRKPVIRRYHNDTSTGNLRRHAEKCWGAGFVDMLVAVGDESQRRKMAERYVRDGTITESFERKGKGKVTYSLRQLTKEESRYVHFVGFAMFGWY